MPSLPIVPGPEPDDEDDPAPVLTPLEVTNYTELPYAIPSYVMKISRDLDTRAPIQKGRVPFNKSAQVRYLMYLARFGLKNSAAQYAGVSSEAVRFYSKNTNPDFADAINEAMDIFKESLEQVALRRAVDGWEEPVYQKGELVGTIHRHSERMLEMLLKRHIPDFKDNLRIDNSVNGGVLLIPSALSAEEWEASYGPNSDQQVETNGPSGNGPLTIEGTVSKEKDDDSTV